MNIEMMEPLRLDEKRREPIGKDEFRKRFWKNSGKNSRKDLERDWERISDRDFEKKLGKNAVAS